MIRIHSQTQLTIEGFESPFERVMDKNNRWVKLGACIPWVDLANVYYASFNASTGRPAKEARLVIGAVIIKHKLKLSDEETSTEVDLKNVAEEDVIDNATSESIQHQGCLRLDATVTEQAIRFPTYLGLLSESREISEQRGVAIFAKDFSGLLLEKSAKNYATANACGGPDSSSSSRFNPTRG